MDTKAARMICRGMAALAISAGVAGMAVSFLFLASASFEDITAGSSGFLAGAILIGSGLMALALLSKQSTSPGVADSGDPAALESA